MAQLVTTDGKVTEVRPANGKSFTLQELQGFVKGYIELVELVDGQKMIINEEGKLVRLPINEKATTLFLIGVPRLAGDCIVGDALIVSDAELGDDEDEE